MLKPLSDRLVVIRDDSTEKSVGGILIPDTAKEKPKSGKVLAVGPGRRLENGEIAAMSVAVNQRVLFTNYGGNETRVGVQDYVILNESDVLAILE